MVDWSKAGFVGFILFNLMGKKHPSFFWQFMLAKSQVTFQFSVPYPISQENQPNDLESYPKSTQLASTVSSNYSPSFLWSMIPYTQLIQFSPDPELRAGPCRCHRGEKSQPRHLKFRNSGHWKEDVLGTKQDLTNKDYYWVVVFNTHSCCWQQSGDIHC